MLVYKCPGNHQRPGGTFDFKAIDDEGLEQALVDGWYETLPEAIEGKSKEPEVNKEPESKPTREEMNQKAAELGLKFDGRTSDAKLLKMIEEKLNVVD